METTEATLREIPEHVRGGWYEFGRIVQLMEESGLDNAARAIAGMSRVLDRHPGMVSKYELRGIRRACNALLAENGVKPFVKAVGMIDEGNFVLRVE